MATQYHFLTSCKKITDTEWIMEIQADSEEIPMSIVYPDSEADEVLAVDPIIKKIADVKIMIRYLRQLNRHSSRGTLGHNDSVIWNISHRFSQLQPGQQIKVKISCIEYKGLRSRLYEINSLGVFSSPDPVQSMTPPASQDQRAQGHQVVDEAIAKLGNRVEILQQELHEAQRILHEYREQLETHEKQIQHLTADNHQLKGGKTSQTTPTQSDTQHSQQPASSQPTPSVEKVDEERPRKSEALQVIPTQSDTRHSQQPASSQPTLSVEKVDEELIDIEAKSLFEQFIKSSRFSKPQSKLPAHYPPKNRDKGS